MRVVYYDEYDTLFIELAVGKVIQGESRQRNVHVRYTPDGIGDITILDAKKKGFIPLLASLLHAKERPALEHSVGVQERFPYALMNGDFTYFSSLSAE